MIAKIKAKKSVEIGSLKKETITPLACIELWYKSEDGYSAQGRYFHEVIIDKGLETERIEEVIIANISRNFTNAQADGLFKLLNVTYPDGATFSQKATLEIQAGLKYIVASEGYFGLTSNDWE